jgi:DNA-binding XRE family transcriptional regulator
MVRHRSDKRHPPPSQWIVTVFSFAGLLRQLRAEARLTQEELAEAGSLSP